MATLERKHFKGAEAAQDNNMSMVGKKRRLQEVQRQPRYM
jgi:hypothetical protein